MGGGRERGGRVFQREGARDRGMEREGGYYKGWEGEGREGEREGERRRLLQREGGRNVGYYKGSIDGWKD